MTPSKLPTFTCASGCTACCRQSPVKFMDVDKARISQLRPDLEWTPWYEGRWLLTGHMETGACPLLGETGCTIHGTDAYPMVCRLYGVTCHPAMTCRHGGQAVRKISDREARRLMRQAEREPRRSGGNEETSR